MRRFRRRVARVEIAIWYADELCGLAYGRISERREVVRIDLVEGRPGGHPLQGWIALIAAETGVLTAQAYGSHAVRFHDPLPGAKFIYEGLGFDFVPATKNSVSFCERRLP